MNTIDVTDTVATGAATIAEVVEKLTPLVLGDIITADDPEYDAVRAVYNAMMDRRPAVIVRCRDAADVVACVKIGTAVGLEIAVRGGGDHAGGAGGGEGGPGSDPR